STIRRAPCSRARRTMSGRLARSPSIENSPSTTTSTPPPSSSARSSMRSSLSTRLCRKGRIRARDIATASRMEAWWPESETPIARKAEVVVAAQHDPVAALHLHHGTGRPLQQAEVGQQVVLTCELELLEPIVGAGLLEEVCGRWHRVRRRVAGGAPGPLPAGA